MNQSTQPQATESSNFQKYEEIENTPIQSSFTYTISQLKDNLIADQPQTETKSIIQEPEVTVMENPIKKEDDIPVNQRMSLEAKTDESKQIIEKKNPKKNIKNKIENDNFLFYSGKLNSRPNNAYIDDIHLYWWYDYALLEQEHGFIQWIFPVFQSGGMNVESLPLNKEEARMIRHDLQCAIRVVRSYKMMLNFYGITLKDESTGEVDKNNIWETRFYNLEHHYHNNLRINRILTSLGHLGFTRYKAPLLRFWEKVIVKEGHLPYCNKSFTHFWLKTIEYDTEDYISKTSEIAEDREDSIFFEILSQNNSNYEEYLKSEEKLQAAQFEARKTSQAKEQEKLFKIRKQTQAKTKLSLHPKKWLGYIYTKNPQTKK
jgi:hypothetical protein